MKNSLYASLLDSQVDIWLANTSQYAAKIEEFYAILSPEEKQRAYRFKFEIHRKRFILSKGILRILLGRYLDISPEQISFDFNAHGKPYLSEEIAKGVLFNLSHTDEQVIYALSYKKEIGVDIEHVRSDFSGYAIAERFFSSYEKNALAVLPPREQQRAFFNLWTRKEAFLKCLGEGLSFPLNKFSISLETNAPQFIELPEHHAKQQWSIFNVVVPDSYVGALVVAGRVGKLNLYNYKVA